MDNLSGGEKTVAALALLFAIHRYVIRSVERSCFASQPVCIKPSDVAMSRLTLKYFSVSPEMVGFTLSISTVVCCAQGRTAS